MALFRDVKLMAYGIIKVWTEQLGMIAIEHLEGLPLYHRETIPVTYLDVMGHVNVRWYMALFDAATWAYFADFGLETAYYKRAHAGAFALQHFIRYLAEVHVNETVTIRTRTLGRSAKRIHFMHFMINETTSQLAATLEALGSHADLQARRTSPFPAFIAEQLDILTTEQSQLGWDAPICGVIRP